MREKAVRHGALKGRRKSDVRRVIAMGGSLVVSIPKQYVKELGIKKGSLLLVLKEKKFLKLLPAGV